MIKVCHITNIHNWDDTRIFYKECISLQKNGFAVSIVAPNVNDQIVKNINVIGVTNKRNSRIYRATIIAFKVFLKALKTESKIYHFHDPELIWIGILLRLFGKVVIFDVHENLRAQIKDKDWLLLPNIATKIYTIFEWLATKMFHIVIAEDSYEELFVTKTKSITKVLNFPMVESLKEYRKDYNERTENGILYVGLVSESRGIFEIIKALAILKSENIQFKFHCIGPISDNLLQKIETSSDYLNVKESIIFYGRLPLFEAYKHSEKCRLALSIMHPMPNYTRSLSTKIFEYMAIGIPFIVSNFPIYSFVINNSLGFVANPLNPDEIAKIIKKTFTSNDSIKKMIDAGYKAVEQNFSWESQEINLIKLYRSLSN
jgi:glycosyltransferase involved in cell wall biosynthesis